MTAPKPAAAPPASGRASAPERVPGREDCAGRRARSESATLLCAVSVALALGVSSGLLINARLRSSERFRVTHPAQVFTETPAAVQTAATLANTPEGGAGGPSGTTPWAEVAAPMTESSETSAAGSPGSSPREEEGGGGVKPSGGAGAEKPDAREESRPAKSPVRRGGVTGVEARPTAETDATSFRGAGRYIPCALHVSTGSLTVRNGGAATVVLSGAGDPGRVTATTPDWSDIAVFTERQAGGGSGSIRYSVRSVSKRQGSFRVTFKSPCGARTIPVTVTPPQVKPAG